MTLRIKSFCIALIILTGFYINIVAYASSAAPITKNNSTKELINYIVAIVNKNIITNNEVINATNIFLNSVSQAEQNKLNTTEVRKSIISQLILQQIQLDIASSNNITVTDLEVNQELQKRANSANATLAEYIKNLHSDLTTMQNQVRNYLIIQKLEARSIGSQLNITDAEVTRIMNSASYKDEVNYNLSFISIPIENNSIDSLKKATAIANNVLGDLRSGKSFLEVAIAYNLPTPNNNNFNIGWRSSAILDPSLVNALQNVKKGGYSDIITLPDRLLIFKVNDFKSIAKTSNIKDQENMIKQQLFANRADFLYNNWIHTIRNTAYVKIIHE